MCCCWASTVADAADTPASALDRAASLSSTWAWEYLQGWWARCRTGRT
jgi:hypothetical protein